MPQPNYGKLYYWLTLKHITNKKKFYFLYIDRNFKACLLNYWKLKKTVPLNDSIFQIILYTNSFSIFPSGTIENTPSVGHKAIL